ncbi:MAG: hypothetical protein ACSHX7_05470 [Luteolibacter sp.]
MRLPFFITIPACLLTILIVWFVSTQNMDFLTPPSEARLQEIRTQTQAGIPVSPIQEDAISVQVPIPAADPVIIQDDPEVVETVDLGDLTSPPVLDTYSNRAPEGAEKLVILGTALEQAGAFQRALLAYERILDLSQAEPAEIQAAISAIQLLRPTLPLWNNDPETAYPVIINIGTGEKFSEELPGLMKTMTKDLRNASSGLINFQFKLNIGRSIQATDAPTPVAIWITGAGDSPPSTDVLSFTTEEADTLSPDILKVVFNLIRSQLQKSSSYNPAPEAANDPLTALDSHITRLLWNEFGTEMNPEKPAE